VCTLLPPFQSIFFLSIIRKSLAVPDLRASLEELEHLYDDDEKLADENEALAKRNADLNKGSKYT
ncbi:MAG: cell division protein FtsB, partial [Bacillariaceae sp.]|jgi:cell division protein FtsB